MVNRSFLLCSVSAALLLWSGVASAQCVMNQDCATLGYTKTAAECSGNGLKCPFGDKWSCVTDRKCQIGRIYYSDRTCSLDVVSGKTALGVVVHMNPDGIGGQVIAARDVGSMYWAVVGDRGMQELSEEKAARDYNSCHNTDKIIARGGSFYLAAHAARSYAPTTETVGKWCLPAAGILTNIYNSQSLVQAGIAKLGGTAYPSCCTWSSSEMSTTHAWVSDFKYSRGLSYGSKTTFNNFHVRPVMEF